LVFVMGLWLLWSRVREWRSERGRQQKLQILAIEHEHQHKLALAHEHHHEHAHDDHHHQGHTHEQLPTDKRLTFKQLFAFGLSGGLVPCPAAIAILLLAVGAGKPVLGLATVLIFSIGLALTLIAIGVAVCHGMKLFEKSQRVSKWMKQLPLISSAVVTALGLAMLIRALFGQGHTHAPKEAHP